MSAVTDPKFARNEIPAHSRYDSEKRIVSKFGSLSKWVYCLLFVVDRRRDDDDGFSSLGDDAVCLSLIDGSLTESYAGRPVLPLFPPRESMLKIDVKGFGVCRWLILDRD